MAAARKEDLVENILTLADHLFRQLLPTIPQELLTMDVTMPQFKIMLILYIHGPMRMSEIAAGLDVTLPTATSLVDKLVDKGFVARENQTTDRRVVICRLSEGGQKGIGKIWESSRIRCQQLLGEMDTEKLQMFVVVLDDMLKTSQPGNKAAIKK